MNSTVVISGASGLVGRAVQQALTALDYTCIPLVRGNTAPASGGIAWDPVGGSIDAASIEGAAAVVHLAGEPITGRWTARKRHRIVESREAATGLLARAIAGLDRPPEVVVSASAVGYYGNRGDDVLTEADGPGSGFLADTCQRWEAAMDPAIHRGIRAVTLRFGIILAATGGALPAMARPIRFGVGGRLASGRQYVPWVSLDDVVRVIVRSIDNSGMTGAYNVTAPDPATNAELTKSIGKALRRPTAFPAPRWALRLALGAGADELLLASQRVVPRRLLDEGFAFADIDVSSTVKRLLA